MAHEKGLLIDVFQAYFYRKDKQGNRKLVFMSENLTSGGITTSQENTDVRNGQGNALFAVLPGTKDVTVNLTENVFSFEALKLNTGGVETAGAATGNTGLILRKPGRYSADELKVGVKDNGTQTGDYARFMLQYVPENKAELSVIVGDAELEYVGQKAQATANKFTLVKEDGTEYDGTNATPGTDKVYILMSKAHGEKLQKDANLKVLPYVYKTVVNKTSTIVVDSKEFSEGGELWLQTVEKDAKQKAVAYVYFVFENAIPEGSFEISTVSEVQPNDMAVNMRILADENGELYRIVREEI